MPHNNTHTLRTISITAPPGEPIKVSFTFVAATSYINPDWFYRDYRHVTNASRRRLAKALNQRTARTEVIFSDVYLGVLYHLGRSMPTGPTITHAVGG